MKIETKNYSVEILKHSKNEAGDEVVTYLLRYPRFIHQELLTHCVLSRNCASSRAIPNKKILDRIWKNPAYPEKFYKNCKGMQGKVEVKHPKLAKFLWNFSARSTVAWVKFLSKLKWHKQVINRMTEPYMHMETLVTATEWDNFFKLRTDFATQPEFRVVAFMMLKVKFHSTPQMLKENEWHLPFVTASEVRSESINELKCSSARSARLSYTTHKGETSHKKDTELHDTLLEEGHMSPFEHQCRPRVEGDKKGKLKGFTAYRQIIEMEQGKPEPLDEKVTLAEIPEWIEDLINNNKETK